MRIAEVNDQTGLPDQLLAHGHIPALGPSQTLAHQLSNAVELVSEGLQQVAALASLGYRQLDQSQQPIGTLDQGTYCSSIGFALDKVAFSVTWNLTVLHLGHIHVDAEDVGSLAAQVLALAA